MCYFGAWLWDWGPKFFLREKELSKPLQAKSSNMRKRVLTNMFLYYLCLILEFITPVGILTFYKEFKES